VLSWNGRWSFSPREDGPAVEVDWETVFTNLGAGLDAFRLDGFETGLRGVWMKVSSWGCALRRAAAFSALAAWDAAADTGGL
jgi:hypothetical protein